MKAPARAVVVEARDLDTDERSRYTVEIGAPSGPGELRDGISAAVRKAHPGAKLRTLHDGAATFLDRQHLIVAHLARPERAREKEAAEQRPESAQESLFAA